MSKVFSEAAVKHFSDNFKNKVGPGGNGGCMKAVYVGLGSLYGSHYGFKGNFFKSFFKSTRKLEIMKVQSGKRRGKSQEGFLNTVDRVFRALEHEGITGAEQQYTPISDESGGGWMLNGSQVNSIESSIENQLKDSPNGPHFFGIAIRGGIHSLTIQVIKSDSGIQVFWMDQFSEGTGACRADGFVRNPDVTGRLDEELRDFGLSAPTSVWLFLPDKAEGVLIPVDSNGDGVMDSTAPAVTEVNEASSSNASSQVVQPTGNDLVDSNDGTDVTIEGTTIQHNQLAEVRSLETDELASDNIEEDDNQTDDFDPVHDELDDVGNHDSNVEADDHQTDDFNRDYDELDDVESDDNNKEEDDHQNDEEDDHQNDNFEPDDDEPDDFENDDNNDNDSQTDDFDPDPDEPGSTHDEPPPSVEDSPDAAYYEAPPS